MSVLKTCPYCGGYGYINQFEDVEGVCRAWANECIACKGTGAILVPETNADRIRRMSDEELAKEINRLMEGETSIPYCRELPVCDEDVERDALIPLERCEQCVLQWLHQSAEE